MIVNTNSWSILIPWKLTQFVLNINDASGKPLISYVLRPAGGTITDVNKSEEIGTGNSTKFPLTVSTDAMNIFAEQAANHPLVRNYHLDLISDNDVDNGGNEIFLFTYEGNGGMFNMSIRKSDGYMAFQGLDGEELIDLDEWYYAQL